MKTKHLNHLLLALLLTWSKLPAAADDVVVTGELREWHKVTLSVAGPEADEASDAPNPFLDFRMTVRFIHESGEYEYVVPGYFAADGNAAETSASVGNIWRAHLAPDVPGRWEYEVAFVEGAGIAIEEGLDALEQATPVDGCHRLTGSFEVLPTDRMGRDFRAQGRLEYVGERYLRFAGTGDYFLKVGADAPETLLAYHDFDGTTTQGRPLKSWEPHLRDWNEGDPTWQDGRGRGLIGACNYLASTGCNAISFLPYNAGGDGNNVWPHVSRGDKLHFDCSKLDQWGIVFDHAQLLGLYLHFKLQETENDDNHGHGNNADDREVTDALDGGDLGVQRKLYLRELIARYGYLLALNWNLGEENTQSPEQQRAMAAYIDAIDPYSHNIVVHTFPGQQDHVYEPLLGEQSVLTGASLQNSWSNAHQRVFKWVSESQQAGRPWVVAQDEQNPANQGVPPDPGYEGFDGFATDGDRRYDLHDIRKYNLWGTLMAGGAGVEYYFGYQLPQNDLICEDWRSRDQSWNYGRIALEFFHDHEIPFWRMSCRDELVGNPTHSNSRYCLAEEGDVYVIYLPDGGTTELDLGEMNATWYIGWYNPREGGEIQSGSVEMISGPGEVSIGSAPTDADQDWVVVVRK